jgi:transcription antitermination protein NusB
MARPREIRRLAFQMLFQLDARGGEAGSMEPSGQEAEGLTPADFRKAGELAQGAYEARERADREMETLAPGWPAHRQAAVDRSILRLAHFEMTSGRTAPKIVVNEAVELAKEFGTEKSPAFVNGLLDKVLKRVLAEGLAASGPGAPETGGEGEA